MPWIMFHHSRLLSMPTCCVGAAASCSTYWGRARGPSGSRLQSSSWPELCRSAISCWLSSLPCLLSMLFFQAPHGRFSCSSCMLFSPVFHANLPGFHDASFPCLFCQSSKLAPHAISPISHAVFSCWCSTLVFILPCWFRMLLYQSSMMLVFHPSFPVV